MAGTKVDGQAIGIDLGTTYSCVAVWQPRHDRAEIMANDQGNRTTPSCVAFTGAWRLIGDAAMNEAAMNPVNTVFGENFSFGVTSYLVFLFFFFDYSRVVCFRRLKNYIQRQSSLVYVLFELQRF
jgi:hypothetical protein